MHQNYRLGLRRVFMAIILGVLVLAAGCRPGAPPVDNTSSEYGSTADSETAVTPLPTSGDAVMALFFIREDHVGYVQRAGTVSGVGPDSPQQLTSTLEALFRGPTPEETAWGFASQVPHSTRVLSVSAGQGLATVDLSAEFATDGDARSMQQRVAQVVFTLTALDAIERVALKVEGEPLRTLGEPLSGLGPSVSRDDFQDVRPQILVVSPAPGATISSPVQVSGESNTPDRTFAIEIVGAKGSPVTEQLASSADGSSGWLPFETSVEFETDVGAGEVVCYVFSSADGSRTYENRIPVVFDE